MDFKLLPRHRQLRRIVSLSGCLWTRPFFEGTDNCVVVRLLRLCRASDSHKGLTIVAIARHDNRKKYSARASRTWTVNQNSFSAEKWKWKANGKRRTENGKQQKEGSSIWMRLRCCSVYEYIAAILKIAKTSGALQGGEGWGWAKSIGSQSRVELLLGSLLLLLACKCFV